MIQAPEAIFVVERRPGQGYGITSAFGPRAQVLQRAAVELLDELGQPDPRGPEEIQRWVPAGGPDRQPVFVRIRRTPDGESVYHQTWFRSSEPVPAARRRLLPWFIAALVLLITGVVLGWTWRGSPMPVPSSPGEQTAKDLPPGPDPGPGVVAVPPTDAALHLALRRTREVRKKVAAFLAQPGLTGWPDEPGAVEPSLELRDFRKTPRGVKIDPVYLNTDEARSLRQLLDLLDRVP